MNKPESAGDSLESILASIRKSLAEQSTDALSEKTIASVAADAETKPRRYGLTQRLAGATPDIPPVTAGEATDDLSDLLEGAPGAAARQPVAEARRSGNSSAEPAPNAAAEQDPLWFLTRREEPDTVPAAAAANSATTEPSLTRPEVLRASLPPFFGSSTPAIPAAPEQRRTSAVSPTPSPLTAATSKQGADAALAHEVSLVAAAAEQAAARPGAAAPPIGSNGKSTPASEQPQRDGTVATGHHQDRALEAMVLELLKPMLRQWLDENMPRLVAEALSEEVRRARNSEGDAGQT